MQIRLFKPKRFYGNDSIQAIDKIDGYRITFITPCDANEWTANYGVITVYLGNYESIFEYLKSRGVDSVQWVDMKNANFVNHGEPVKL